ncbi:MAG TPA: hypothetical protein VN698_07080 [Bacteroidia bacterium]|nr:hypothetical protein [Bacteroidia bacterium]
MKTRQGLRNTRIPRIKKMTTKEKERAKQDKYLLKLEKHSDVLRSNKLYSIQRIDLLIISVCSAGIYASTEIMKYIASSKILNYTQINNLNIPFKVAGFMFLFSIISNFISQWGAYKDHSISLESNKLFIHSLENEEDETEKIEKMDCKAKQFGYLVNYGNILSIMLMFLGLIYMMFNIGLIF